MPTIFTWIKFPFLHDIYFPCLPHSPRLPCFPLCTMVLSCTVIFLFLISHYDERTLDLLQKRKKKKEKIFVATIYCAMFFILLKVFKQCSSKHPTKALLDILNQGSFRHLQPRFWYHLLYMQKLQFKHINGKIQK